MSLNEWQAGFKTQLEIFNWVSTSRFYNPRRILETKSRKVPVERVMYHAFFGYASAQISQCVILSRTYPSLNETVDEAKIFYDKKEEYENLVRITKRRNALKSKFNGKLVMEWTGLFGLSVRRVMDVIRARFSDEEILDCNVDLLKATTLQVQQDLGLDVPKS